MLAVAKFADHHPIMSIEQKLHELKALLDTGLISQAEHDTRRAKLLDDWQQSPAEGADPYATDMYRLGEGDTIGPQDNRYRLLRFLGGGGMGQVWLAQDLAEEKVTGRDCHRAVKLVHPEMLKRRPQAVADLQKEAIQARDLRHEHIVAVQGWRRGDDGWALVVMEHLEGGTLRDLLQAEGNPGLPLERVLALLEPLVSALAYAHARGVIHRDIKPDNVMLSADGVIKLVDFGLAFQLRRTASASGLKAALPAWTPEYVAPEVARFNLRPTPQHDVYSLACLCWELLVGEPPFSAEMAYSRQAYHQLPRQGLPKVLYQGLCEGFAFEPDERPASVEAFLALLRRKPEPPRPIIELIHGWSCERVQVLQQQTAAALGLPVGFRDRLADGSEGPEMRVIPAGKFLMGSPENETDRIDNKERQHEVTIESTFALCSEAMSFALYDRFCAATGRDRPGDEGWGRGDRPVINVSWEDALACCAWLSEQTQQRYRLPSEAEWEYACRAGTATAFWFGDGISVEQANYDWNHGKTLGVRTFAANPWGLYQMHGNVLEWTGSVYEESYDGSELQILSNKDDKYRVLRGGAWDQYPWMLRSAYRLNRHPSRPHLLLSFRLARTL